MPFGLLYDIKGTWRGLKKAWEFTIGKLPTRVDIRNFLSSTLALGIAVSGVAYFFYTIVVLLTASDPSNSNALSGFFPVSLYIVITSLFGGLLVNSIWKPRPEESWEFAILINPITGILIIPVMLIAMVGGFIFHLFRFIIKLPYRIKRIALFLKTAAFFILSDEIILCSTSIAMGAVAGHFALSVVFGGIYGAMTGMTFGVLSYEVLSKRVFKLA